MPPKVAQKYIFRAENVLENDLMNEGWENSEYFFYHTCAQFIQFYR